MHPIEGGAAFADPRQGVYLFGADVSEYESERVDVASGELSNSDPVAMLGLPVAQTAVVRMVLETESAGVDAGLSDPGFIVVRGFDPSGRMIHYAQVPIGETRTRTFLAPPRTYRIELSREGSTSRVRYRLSYGIQSDPIGPYAETSSAPRLAPPAGPAPRPALAQQFPIAPPVFSETQALLAPPAPILGATRIAQSALSGIAAAPALVRDQIYQGIGSLADPNLLRDVATAAVASVLVPTPSNAVPPAPLENFTPLEPLGPGTEEEAASAPPPAPRVETTAASTAVADEVADESPVDAPPPVRAGGAFAPFVLVASLFGAGTWFGAHVERRRRLSRRPARRA